VLKRHWRPTFLYQHGHKQGGKLFCPSILIHFSPKVLTYPSVQAPEPCSISFFLDSGIMQQLQQMPLQFARANPQAKTSCIGHLHTSALLGKAEHFPSLPWRSSCRTHLHVLQLFHWSMLPISCLLPPAFSVQPTVNGKRMPSLDAASSFACFRQAWIHAVSAISVAEGRGKNSAWYLYCQDSRGILACQWHGTFYEAVSWVTS